MVQINARLKISARNLQNSAGHRSNTVTLLFAFSIESFFLLDLVIVTELPKLPGSCFSTVKSYRYQPIIYRNFRYDILHYTDDLDICMCVFSTH